MALQHVRHLGDADQTDADAQAVGREDADQTGADRKSLGPKDAGGKAADQKDAHSHDPEKKAGGVSAAFERFAAAVTARAGSPAAFCIALSLVVVWAVSGPVFGFSETWQLVINTGTTIITFLMVFLIQQSQNKDSQAIHVKLDELLKLAGSGSNEMIDIEDLTEAQIKHLGEQFKRKNTGS